jgi:predicted ATP-dependent endonuclease of OLD family
MRRRIYLCEGETEQHLIKALKEKGLIEPGKPQVFNVAQRDVKKMLRKWGRERFEIVLVVDADTGPYTASSRLAKNIEVLKKSHMPCLILQCENLEDELVRCCGIGLHMLCNAFNASSASEFKEKFLNVRQARLIEKLEHCGFDFNNLWQMHCKCDSLDSTLHGYLFGERNS